MYLIAKKKETDLVGSSLEGLTIISGALILLIFKAIKITLIVRIRLPLVDQLKISLAV